MGKQKNFTQIILTATIVASLLFTACGKRKAVESKDAPKNVVADNTAGDERAAEVSDSEEIQRPASPEEAALMDVAVDTAMDSMCLHLPSTSAPHIREMLDIHQELMSPVITAVGSGYGQRCLYNKKNHPGIISIFINKSSSVKNFATVKKEVVGGEIVDTQDPAFDEVFFQEISIGPHYAVAIYGRKGKNQVIVQSGTSREQVTALANEIIADLSQ